MNVDLVVVGLGYVGLPLAQEATRSGLTVVGYDVAADAVAGLNAGTSHIDDLSDSDIDEMRAAGFVATTDPTALATADVGIAMGAHGATAASESADAVVLRDDLSKVAQARVMPSQQRLHLQHFTAVEVHDGLVMEGELLLRKRVAELMIDVPAAFERTVRIRRVEAQTVLAGALDHVHRTICVTHQRGGVLRVVRVEGDADAGRDADIGTVDHDRGGQHAEDSLGDVAGRSLRRNVAGNHHELVTGQADDQVVVSHGGLEPTTETLQQQVAGIVPEGIVDDLEAVDVDEHGGHGAVPVGGDEVLESALEHSPVG